MLIQLTKDTFDTVAAAPSLAPPSIPSLHPWTREGPNFDELLARIEDEGLSFRGEVVASYLLALQTKRFVLLAGTCGAGKTKLAQFIAATFVGSSSPDGCGSEIIAVRPDWTDDRGLLGFYNRQAGTFETTPFLRLLLRAGEEELRARACQRPPAPFFIILDELNLAPVERYLSTFLSCVESGEPLYLHDDPLLEKGGCGSIGAVPRTVPIPANLFITGTVNVDPSSAPFSSKVLDRTFTIELGDVDLESYGIETHRKGPPGTLALQHFSGGLQIPANPGPEDWRRFRTLERGGLANAVSDLNNVLWRAHAHFGYRTANEIARFVCLAAQQAGCAPEKLWTALDIAILGKALPKLQGARQDLERILGELRAYARGAGSRPPFPRCDEKLQRMQKRLESRGYASYME